MVATKREIDFSEVLETEGLEPGMNYERGYFPRHQKTAAAAGEGSGVALFDFWNKRAELQHIHQFAKARRGNPWAVLGVVMARMMVRVPPYVVTPAIVGGVGALNLFVNLTGRSGAGKGVARAIAEEAVLMGEVKQRPLGTGEGLCRLLAVQDGKKRSEPVLVDGGEVDVISALKSRQGSTLTGILRSAFSGSQLGFTNARGDTSVNVAAHTYRVSMVMDVQPEQAGPLMNEAGGGTPQRYLWMPARDPEMTTDKPTAPPPAIWVEPAWPARKGRRFAELKVAEAVVEAIDEGIVQRNASEDNPLDAHAGSVQLRIAVALALMAGRANVTIADWRLAQIVMTVSDNMRQEVQRTLTIVRLKEAKDQGKRYAHSKLAQREAEDDLKQKRIEACKRAIGKHVGDAWISRSKFANSHLRSNLKPYLDQAIEELDGKLIEIGGAKQGGLRMRRLDMG